jgi:uncharacterized protein YciI
MSEFLALLTPSRATFPGDATPEETAIVARHFGHLQGLWAEGRLIIAGRTREDADLPPVPPLPPLGVVVFEAESEAHARSDMDDDPAVSCGLFLCEIRPFGIALER